MSEALEHIESLVSDFQYVEPEHDRIVLTVGFTVSLYFWGGHTPEKRKALVECVEAYEAAYGSELQWGCDPDTWQTVQYKSKALPEFREYVRTLDEDDAVQWYVASGDDDEAANDYAIACQTERGWMEGQISSLRFQAPRSTIFDAEQGPVLLELIDNCCRRLAPFHGHAGLSAVTTEQQIEWEPEELDVATRYLGLYVGEGADVLQAPNGIKSLNWMTFVGNALTYRVGGPVAFNEYCHSRGLDPILRDWGLILKAGEFPKLGYIEEPQPEDYIRINAALRPLRNGNFGSMGSGSVSGERRFNRCTTDLWIRRYDAPDTWPPKSFVGLSRTLVGKPPEQPIKLATGARCAVHGRYRHGGFEAVPPGSDDDAPHVVLLPGDVAPFWLVLGPHGELLKQDKVTWELVATL